MDKSYVIDCVRSFAQKAKECMDVREVILFGSYASDTATDNSDIDVAVITDTPAEDWLEASTRLFQLRRNINLSIEPILIDSQSDRSGFLADIRQTGEIIFSRDS